MIGCPLLLAMLLATGDHATANPLFQDLQTQGIAIHGDVRVKLTAPTLGDGLDEVSQQAILKKTIGNRYPLEEFVRDSVVAPLVLKFPDVQRGVVAARGVDLWFIVHGDLNALANVDVLERLSTARGHEATLHVLSASELVSRKLPPPDAEATKHVTALGETNERFVYTVSTILDRVELHHTSRCLLSRTEDSVVIASVIDRRFDSDPDFPNIYHRLEHSELGESAKGPPQPYSGAGGYLKATRLAQPKGAILVEYHMIYSEPHDWFNGANLLQSKLPVLLQSRVRSLRREAR